MRPVSDYQEAFDIVNELAPDFISAAIDYKAAPTPQEKKEFETKAAYVLAMYETIKMINNIRYNALPQTQPQQRSSSRPNYSRESEY